MINRFLKAKHWQLFLLMFGIPILFQVFSIASIFFNKAPYGNPDPIIMLNLLKSFPIIMLLYTGLLFGWFWSIAHGLQKYIKAENKLKLSTFKIFFFIPLIYILFFVVFLGGSFYGISNDNVLGLLVFSKIIPIILPLHLFSMFCIFYQLNFVSKTIKTVELQRKVTFSDYLGEFFMIWFFPIGIWAIQPKLNKFVNQELIDESEKTN